MQMSLCRSISLHMRVFVLVYSGVTLILYCMAEGHWACCLTCLCLRLSNTEKTVGITQGCSRIKGVNTLKAEWLALSNFSMVFLIIIHVISCHWIYSLRKGKRKSMNKLISQCCLWPTQGRALYPWKIMIMKSTILTVILKFLLLYYIFNQNGKCFAIMSLVTSGSENLINTNIINPLSHHIRIF